MVTCRKPSLAARSRIPDERRVHHPIHPPRERLHGQNTVRGVDLLFGVVVHASMTFTEEVAQTDQRALARSWLQRRNITVPAAVARKRASDSAWANPISESRRHASWDSGEHARCAVEHNCFNAQASSARIRDPLSVASFMPPPPSWRDPAQCYRESRSLCRHRSEMLESGFENRHRKSSP